MSTILALESSGSACSVALQHRGRVYQRQSFTPRAHTRLLLPMVEEVLSEAQLTLADVDALAFSSGPGSFTGLRIAFGMVQGLAFSHDIPVIPIPTLEALAQAACEHFALNAGDRILPALDARKEEIYWGCYRMGEDGRLQEEQNNAVSAAADMAVAGDVAVGVGDGWLYAEHIAVKPAQVTADFALTATAVLTLAQQRFEAGLMQAAHEAELVYIRDEVAWKKRERLSPPT